MKYRETRPRVTATRRAALVLVVLALLSSACGGKDADDAKNSSSDVKQGVESGLEDAGDPVRGGKVIYGLEAETNGGFCLPEAQLAIAGIQVARTLYDTLTIPNEDGEYVPYLAESVEANDGFNEWTIKLREGVKFHDGTDLTAEVVKNNLDAYRGKYEGRTPLLFLFVFSNVSAVDVVDPLTVKVTTAKPWVAFPAYLFSSGRLGIAAQSQLDDTKTCDTKMVGTGPFKLKEWKIDQRLIATKNEDYWYEAPDEKPYPYLDEIEYRPITEVQQRVNALETGDITAMHTSASSAIVDLRESAKADELNLLESNKFGEVSFTQLNASEPPLDDLRVRQALAYGVDRKEIIEIIEEGLPVQAEGPFAPGNVGHLEDSGFPAYDPDKAKELIADYKEETGTDQVEFTLSSTTDPLVLQLAELVQNYGKDIGIDISLKTVEQATLIDDAIAGNFQAQLFRNYPGGDPDTQYVWWYWGGGNPVNFGRIDDPEIDRLLDEGRSEPDAAKRKDIYEDLNRRFAEQAWSIWAWYTPWSIALGKNVHNVYGPDNPDGSKPYPGLATGHPVTGLWVADA